MKSNKDKMDTKVENRNCSEPGKVNLHVKIDGRAKEKEWDFLHGCWKETSKHKSGWDLRFTS